MHCVWYLIILLQQKKSFYIIFAAKVKTFWAKKLSSRAWLHFGLVKVTGLTFAVGTENRNLSYTILFARLERNTELFCWKCDGWKNTLWIFSLMCYILIGGCWYWERYRVWFAHHATTWQGLSGKANIIRVIADRWTIFVANVLCDR